MGVKFNRYNIMAIQTIYTSCTQAAIFSCEAETLREAVEKAVAEGVSLEGADLFEADLSGAGLVKAKLHGANLAYANLEGATIWDADLSAASLFRANLTGAKLVGADLFLADLDGVIGLKVDKQQEEPEKEEPAAVEDHTMESPPSNSSRLVYTIRIVYKSGYTHDFDVYSFEVHMSTGQKTYSWEAVSVNNSPVVLGGDDIAAVWQVGVKSES